MKESTKKNLINESIIRQFLNLEIDNENRFLTILDWVRREFYVLIKQEMENINWLGGNWLNDIENIHDILIKGWEQIETSLLQYKYSQIKRLKGVLYEVLFYLSSFNKSTLFKGSWIMEISGNPLIPDEEPPWLEIIPIYDILPKVFKIKENDKWVSKAPQIEADFIVCYWNPNKRNVLPLTFIDVKTNLKNYVKKNMIWSALGCKWFFNSILQVVTPKILKNTYPKKLDDWDVYLVCWNCGVLNQNSVYCKECKNKIWLVEKEQWDIYPLK